MGRRLGLVGHHRGQAGQHAVSLKRRLALHRRVQRGAEPPQVGGGARTPAARAFRRDVRRRTHQHTGDSQTQTVDGFRDPEVGEHDPPPGSEQDVGRLHITVHHPGVVRGAQAGQHAETDLRRITRRQGPVLTQDVTQRRIRD